MAIWMGLGKLRSVAGLEDGNVAVLEDALGAYRNASMFPVDVIGSDAHKAIVARIALAQAEVEAATILSRISF